jgi:hypothetical protein
MRAPTSHLAPWGAGSASPLPSCRRFKPAWRDKTQDTYMRVSAASQNERDSASG